MKNSIEIKDNVVCKKYSSRIDFVKEESLYKKLKGTGLAPELVESHDGYLEHEYVEGKSFLDLLVEADGNRQLIKDYFQKFCVWYERYRELTKMTLGKIRFEKFILSGDRLCNLDFEHCRPGYMEDDFARLVAQMCVSETPFDKQGMELARFFIYVASKTVSWIPDIFYNSLSKAIIEECRNKGVPVNEKKMEMLATLLTSAGIVFVGQSNSIYEYTRDMELLPERYISVAKNRTSVSSDIDDFVKVVAGNKDSSFQRLVDAEANVAQVWTVCVTTDMPRIPDVLWQELLSAEKKGYAAVVVEAGGKLREYPMLLNTAKTRLELKDAFLKGKTSVLEALSKMKINVIRVEDIRK